ncbi:MAG: PPC domain-containing DNA-binding protein [Desulfotomaculales bacterium]
MKKEAKAARVIVGRLKKGDDLLEALTKECAASRIVLGEVRAIGAVSRARVGYYDQKSRLYRYLEFGEPMEILSLAGNISLKEGRPFVHAHVTLADGEGRACGGHLAEGTEVFACEFVIREYLSGEPFERAFDPETGLFLWPEKREAEEKGR